MADYGKRLKYLESLSPDALMRGEAEELEFYRGLKAKIERLENLLMVYADPTEMSDDDAKLMSEIYQRFENRSKPCI